MSLPELLTFAFAAAFLIAAAIARSRRGVLGAALLMSAVVIASVALPPAARQWGPLLYLAGGYWVPAVLVTGGSDPRFMEWLRRADATILPRAACVPEWLVHVSDLAYLLCYPLVPAGYAVLLAAGSAPDRERFWVAVLLAGFSCYATLPWLPSLPPRRLSSDPNQARPIGKVNVAVLSRVSHGLNTFPSGHAAVATAVTLALLPVPRAAIACGAIAAGVALGAVVGRHHYLIDVLLGVAVGVTAALVSFAVA